MSLSPPSSHQARLAYTPWPAAVAARYRKLGLWQDKTLYEHFLAQAQRDPSAVALISPGPPLRQISYGELKDAAGRVAAGLSARGLKAQDAIVIQLGNDLEFFITLLACCQSGIVAVLALPAHGAYEIGAFCQQVGAKLLLTSSPAAEPDSAPIPIIVAKKGSADWQALLAEPAREDFVTAKDCPVALLQVSGGTTGTPKLIPRTHNDYAYSIVQSNARCAISAETVMLIALPCAHNFPLSSPGSLGVLFAGGTVVLASSGRAGVALPLIAPYGVTTVALVPALLKQWLLSPMARRMPPSDRWQSIQVGGQKLDPHLADEAMAQFEVTIQQVFGMAEGLVCYTPLGAQREVLIHSQGLPMSPYDEIAIVDDDDQPVADGQPGHLLTRGPYTVRGYFRAPGHNARAFTTDGFYRTGDIVRLRRDGGLEVCGRSKEQINRGGEKIACHEIEELALALPGIAYAALVGVPDALLGEKSLLVVVSELGDAKGAIKAHLKARGLAAYKIPDQVAVIDAMPLTAVGKIDKKALISLGAREGSGKSPQGARL